MDTAKKWLSICVIGNAVQCKTSLRGILGWCGDGGDGRRGGDQGRECDRVVTLGEVQDDCVTGYDVDSEKDRYGDVGLCLVRGRWRETERWDFEVLPQLQLYSMSDVKMSAGLVAIVQAGIYYVRVSHHACSRPTF